jgi:bifunctional DNA-binding transcriptional regulator/antitoxin component of YhaV-PrlF toxin-antitoxin module
MTALVDRFGRVVIPRDIRQRHGWGPGVPLRFIDGPDGLTITSADHAAAEAPRAPDGLAWVDGLLVATGDVPPDAQDLLAHMRHLDAQRDQDLFGGPENQPQRP